MSRLNRLSGRTSKSTLLSRSRIPPPPFLIIILMCASRTFSHAAYVQILRRPFVYDSACCRGRIVPMQACVAPSPGPASPFLFSDEGTLAPPDVAVLAGQAWASWGSNTRNGAPSNPIREARERIPNSTRPFSPTWRTWQIYLLRTLRSTHQAPSTIVFRTKA